jgi:hypothetical protein
MYCGSNPIHYSAYYGKKAVLWSSQANKLSPRKWQQIPIGKRRNRYHRLEEPGKGNQTKTTWTWESVITARSECSGNQWVVDCVAESYCRSPVIGHSSKPGTLRNNAAQIPEHRHGTLHLPFWLHVWLGSCAHHFLPLGGSYEKVVS